MIEVRHITDEGDVIGVSIMGHAGAAEVGQDIVCAAASMLFYTLVERLEELKANISFLAEKGNALVVCSDTLSKQEKEVFATIDAGFKRLAEQYPEYIVLV